MSETRLKITREVCVPDKVKLARSLRTPDLGPRILFFSGGTALRDFSKKVINYTHNSVHLITPFDSGGSSAVLRESFQMLAVGDLRNRLMALADQSLHGNPEIFALFAYRLPKDHSDSELRQELDDMVIGRHELVANIPDPMRKIIRHYLLVFAKRMSDGFNLRGASIGNLVLSGGYLENQRHIDPVLYIFSKLVQVRGVVRPIVNKYLHLVAELQNGQQIIGQHLLTGKETNPIDSRVKRIYLTENRDEPQPVSIAVRDKIKKRIKKSELICYPIGSFYSSILANFLPQGVGEAISETPCPKVYIPNTAPDPESFGLTLRDQVGVLIDYLLADAKGKSIGDILNFVLLDTDDSLYSGGVNRLGLLSYGVEIIRCPLVSEKSRPYIDPDLLVQALISLV